MATSTTPPPLKGPTAKEKKYDRQLRLWAAAGQQALEEANILLINTGCGVVGVETLKNLILPGVGNFTVVDENLVGEEDLGVNFFLSEESLGKSRAEESCRLLQELNPEVNGTAIQQSIEEFVGNKANLAVYNLIIAVSPIHTTPLETLIHYTWNHDIPLFHISSAGFYSTFSLQLPPEFPIVDTHPDPTSTQDLRLLNPWPELSDFARVKTANLESLSDHEHGHIPYLLLLLYYLEEWKSVHDGKVPQNYKEKSTFRDMVKQGIRKDNPEGGEENYDEAIGAVLKSLNQPDISSGLREIFEAEECQGPNLESANFWIIASAIRQFHTTYKVLPLPGALPDMKSQSSDYVQLQNIYKAKARKDGAEIASIVRSIETQLGKSSIINEKEIEAFCKGAAFVKLIRGKPMRSGEIASMKFQECAKYLIRELEDDQSLISIYVSMRIADYSFNLSAPQRGFGTYKEINEQLENSATKNIEKSKTTSDESQGTITLHADTFFSTLQKYGVEYDAQAVKERVSPVLSELERANGSELHNISALTGGMVAQEAIKVITKQYVPVNGTCVFDGLSSKSMVLKL